MKTTIILGLFSILLSPQMSSFGQNISYFPLENQKGNVSLHFSLPHINQFYFQPEGEADAKTNTGFWGINLGLNYYHSQNQYLSLNGSAVSDFFIPVPGAIDISGEYELMTSSYLSLTHNHQWGRFSLGYGLAYGKNTWDLRYVDRFDPPPPSRTPVKKTSTALGFAFPIYAQIKKRFHLGVIYRPTLLRLDIQPAFQYEHLISFDFAWRFRLKQ